MHFRLSVALVLLAICCAGCNATTPPQPPQDQLRDFAASFERRAAQSDCHFIIRPDGTYSLHRTIDGHQEGESGTMSGHKTWADLLLDLKSPQDEYPAPAGSADGYQYSANWNDRTIKWNSHSPDLPAALQTLTDMLNKLFDEPTKGAS